MNKYPKPPAPPYDIVIQTEHLYSQAAPPFGISHAILFIAKLYDSQTAKLSSSTQDINRETAPVTKTHSGFIPFTYGKPGHTE